MNQATQQQGPRRPRIVRGPLRSPERLLIYGMEGVGKSSFVGGRRLPDGVVVPGAPRPIFLDLDRGSSALDVARLGDPNDPENTVPATYGEVVSAIRWLKDPEYRGDRLTLCIDTIDKLEREIIWPETTARYRNTEKPDAEPPRTIADIGWAKGYVQALDVWAEFLRELDHLQAVTGMGIVLVSHATKAKVENLRGTDFSTYEPDLYVGKNSSAAELVREWAEGVFFVGFDDDARREPGDGAAKKAGKGPAKLGKGFTTGERKVWTTHQGWAMAKNRFCLPEDLPLEWSAYAAAVDAYYSGAWKDAPRDAETLRRQIASGVRTVVGWPETAATWYDETFAPHLVKAGEDVEKLTRVLDLLTQKVAKREADRRPAAG